MLVARSQHLGGLRARVVGSPSGIQSHNNDGLPPRPNATRARADDINAPGTHSNSFTPFLNTRSQNTHRGAEDIRVGVEVGNIDGTCSERLVEKLSKNRNWTNDQLEATLHAVDDGAFIKRIMA